LGRHFERNARIPLLIYTGYAQILYEMYSLSIQNAFDLNCIKKLYCLFPHEAGLGYLGLRPTVGTMLMQTEEDPAILKLFFLN
jgi:hypothetical protein